MSISIVKSSYHPPLAGGWQIVALLSVVGCLNYLDRTMITTMRESITHALPMSDAQFGLLTSVFLWTYGLLSPFAGFLADKFNRSRVIIVSLFVWSLVTWLTAHVTSFEQLLATRALMGISEACYIPAALAMITDYHRGSTRSLATGLHMGGVMFGQSLGFLGGWIAERYLWTDAFNVFGLIGVGYAVILLFFLRDSPDKERNSESGQIEEKVNFWSGVFGLFKRRSFVLLLIFWGMLGIVGWIIMAWLPTYYQESFNLSQATAGLYATGYVYPVSMIGVLVGGFLSDRWSRTNPLARIYLPAIGLCIAAAGVFFAGSTGMLYLAIIGFMLYALTRVFSDTNLMPILCMISDSRYRATGYGVLNMFSCIVGGLGIYVSGVLRDADVNLSIMFKLAAVSMLLCAAVLLLIKAKMEQVKS
ncbi:MFS transporter [Pedobacter gandavensis]|uniref:MFS transporter n=1 Tax=Pedobacter gandavensis TaxID=2679963 RepID=A0ABR6ETM4_9SPHI|nr:MFS transporter [Pedobacter gandavensis]MBB2148615.1 MFS transporter [Pedobacter gandavensis]